MGFLATMFDAGHKELQRCKKIANIVFSYEEEYRQLTDEQLCLLLESVVGDYAEKVQNWVIEANWINLLGKSSSLLQDPKDLAYAMTTKTLDFTKELSYLFSKEVGLQQRGNFELKKDFITVEKGKQCYVIPAGREINKVLYVTPSTTKAALYGNLGTLDGGFGGGLFGFVCCVGGFWFGVCGCVWLWGWCVGVLLAGLV